MKFKLIKGYWEIIVLFLCLIVPLAQGWQFILIYRSTLEFLVYLIALIIALIFCLIIGIYWVIELVRMLIYSLKKNKLKYSPVKTLIKAIGVPLLIFSYILLAAYTDTIRLKLSESALINCVNNPNLCQYNTRIGWFYVKSIRQREGCTFFKTGIFMFDEFGIAYVPPGKENCLYLRNDGSDGIVKIYGNWWDYYYPDL
ncbi:MAG: hypothetical protein F6K23_19470 [Okeania sp. SIO2C9]|uniref:hypothetical protein n=1 Tax=Okeania sp. SIO2C9 TaxID=2607791 RepID=UPI0013C02676|nr:hypothetical protein [Okeania sp. SIO2C9]NEQ75024.1 hypothetical protein [Okeania sp. SIO2C9]